MKPINLYLNITRECNINCSYCYIKNSDYKNSKIDISAFINSIEKIHPSNLFFTGGECLLYPKIINDIINYFKKYKNFYFYTVICSNLMYKNFTNEQINAISKVKEIQTTISFEKFKNTKDYRLFLNNILFLHNKFPDKKISLILTISDDFIKFINPRHIMFINKFPINFIKPESISYYKSDSVNWDLYYRNFDNYLGKIFENIDNDKNNLKNIWVRGINNNNIVECNICNNGYSFTFIDGKILNSCNCLIKKENRLRKFKKYCINCNLFKYCKMGCERYGNYCAFPKNTFLKVLNDI